MSQTPNTAIAVIGIDIGKNSFHVVDHDGRGTMVLRQKWSRGQVEARLANMSSRPGPPHRTEYSDAPSLLNGRMRSRPSSPASSTNK
jgi:hypothetical protein